MATNGKNEGVKIRGTLPLKAIPYLGQTAFVLDGTHKHEIQADPDTKDWILKQNEEVRLGRFGPLYVVPGTCSLKLDRKPSPAEIPVIHFDERGFPLWIEPTKRVLQMMVFQMICDGQIETPDQARVNFEFTLTDKIVIIPVEQRLSGTAFCICGRKFRPDELWKTKPIGKNGEFLAHKECAHEYYRKVAIHEICWEMHRTFVDNSRPIGYQAQWGKTIRFTILPKKHNNDSDIDTDLSVMFDTPLGHIRVDVVNFLATKLTINITFEEDVPELGGKTITVHNWIGISSEIFFPLGMISWHKESHRDYWPEKFRKKLPEQSQTSATNLAIRQFLDT